jgi:long-chain acyl-CoA synthetase
VNIAEWLAATARRTPEAPALLCGARVVSDYTRFAATAASIGGYLVEQHGVGPGDRVAVYLTNSVRYLECLYGIWWCGAIAVPINRKLALSEVDIILADSAAAVVFTDEPSHPAATSNQPTAIRVQLTADGPWPVGRGPAEPVSRELGDVAWLFYTSGTTGRPKGVMLTNGNLIAMALCQLSDVDPVERPDAVLYAAPISHGAGLYGLAFVRKGARHVLPPSGRFDADEVLALAAAVDRVTLFAAPTMVRRLTAAARARGTHGDGLRTVIYGGGPMYLVDLRAAISVFGQRFAQIYGQGESPMTITALSKQDHGDVGHPRHEQRLAGVGTAQSAVLVRVCGPDATPVPAGEIGEIEVKGATVMAGYWRDERATAEAIRDGWLRTGDLGRLDEDGYLTLTGRAKELIISGGTNIHPREVEDALVAHPAVAEAAVIGLPDPEWGEIVIAFVVAADDREMDPRDLERSLEQHCIARIARFKRPRQYHIVTELPRNAYGKVVKSSLPAAPTALIRPQRTS